MRKMPSGSFTKRRRTACGTRQFLAAIFLTAFGGAAFAGDEAACCSDLENRIAELETAAIRKGNRHLSLEVSGHVHRALMHWDDGHETNTYSVDPTNWGSYTQFSGEAEIADKWEAGFLLSIEYPLGESISLNQNEPRTAGTPIVSRSSVFVSREQLGRLSIGKEAEAHDHIIESDLSGTGLFAGPGITDWNGSFFVTGPSAAKVPANELTWIALSSATIGDGENANIIRYDTAEVQGFKLAASWGNDNVAAVALRYNHDDKLFEIEAGAAVARYEAAGASPCVDLEPVGHCTTFAASASVLHKASGISLSGAGGMIVDDPRSNSASGGGSDYWLYGKVAQEWKISSLGPTVLFGEFFHGRHHGHIALDPLLSGGATEAGVSAETEMFGVGIMQSIEEADMQAYLAWRTYSVGGDAALGAGGAREALRLDDFQAIMAGSRINF